MASDKKNSAQIEYKRYETIEQFFNEKRQRLLESTPSAHSFHHRVTPNTRGERIWPLPAGRLRETYSETSMAEARKRSIGRRRRSEHDARYCLARHQLMTMWNAELFTKKQRHELARATPKMRSLIRKYRLREVREDTGEEVRRSGKRKSRHDADKDAVEGWGEPSPKRKKTGSLADEMDLNVAQAKSYPINPSPSSSCARKKHQESEKNEHMAGNNLEQNHTRLRSKQAPHALLPYLPPPATKKQPPTYDMHEETVTRLAAHRRNKTGTPAMGIVNVSQDLQA